MLGATVVQYATAILINGYGFIKKLRRELNDLLNVLGYKVITDVIGFTIKEQLTDAECAVPVYKKARAIINKNKCMHCGRCISLAFCDAITKHKKNIKIDSYLCDGCGFCISFCESMAISLEEY